MIRTAKKDELRQYAKFGQNRCSSFDNTHVFRFREFGSKTPIHTPKLRVLGVSDPINGEQYEKNRQKGTSLRESASFEPSCVKIRQRVWPVGEFLKKGMNKNNFGYISPICPETPVDGYAPNLAQS